MTILNQGKISEKMNTLIKGIAESEGVDFDFLQEKISSGEVIIPYNSRHINLSPIGIGKGLSVKINANIGTSPLDCNLENELAKLQVALKYGADTVMDLSTGGNLDEIRREIIRHCPKPVGTVPIYQVMTEVREVTEFNAEKMWEAIVRHAEDGVDFITVHCGVTKPVLQKLTEHPRKMGVVSRGGSFLGHWMKKTGQENPLYSQFDKLLEIAKRYDLTLSLGDGLRPGCLADATDPAQIEELITLGDLARRALKAGVEVMIEGPGHIPLHEIETNVKLQQALCHRAPFYVLGPLVTDIAPGYDQITAAIGGALAGLAGADFLCYVTPSEHLSLPTVEDVRQGVIATKIAAHAVDLARGKKQAWVRDNQMAKARFNLDWEKQIQLSIDPDKARSYRQGSKFAGETCTMCGEHCAIRHSQEMQEMP